MDPQNREPLTEDIREENTDNMKDAAEKAQPVPVYAERAETVLPEADGDELKALALSYARYLAEHDLHPGEPTFTDSVPDTEPEEEPPEEEPATEQEVSAEASSEVEPSADAAEEELTAEAGAEDAAEHRFPSAGRQRAGRETGRKAAQCCGCNVPK